MANDDNNLSFQLDLDSDSFVESAKKALESIKQIGEGGEGGLSSLLGTFSEVGVALGVAAVAVGAFKESLDLSIEGEEIQRIQNQFDTLTAQAGISGEALKSGLEKSADGLVSTTELLKTANTALVQMGASANQLPQIMELARKSTALMGGDLESNFAGITNAIERGNVRMLQHMGIVIDQKKAYQTYAQSIGVTAGELSKAGRQQAILNAVLAAGGEQFKGVNPQLGEVTGSFARLKVALTEFGEAFVVIFEKVVGPALAKALQGVTFLVDGVRKGMTGMFKALEDLSKFSYNKVVETHQEADKKNEELDTQAVERAKTNAKAVEKVEAAVQAEILKLHEERDKFDSKAVTSQAEIDRLMKDQQLAREQSHLNALRKIKEQYGENNKRADALNEAETQRYRSQERQAVAADFTYKTDLLRNYQHQSTNVFQGIAREAQITAMISAKEMVQWGDISKTALQGLNTSATSAFTAIGNGSKSLSDGMLSIVGGMVGTLATNYGQAVLLKGIADSIMLNPMGPPEIAAGGALLAFGGFMSSLGGGSASSSSVSSPSVSTGSASISAPAITAPPTTPNQSALAQQQQTPQRAVTVNIAGNYLNTPASQRTIMEMMRNETDATSFQYNSIGAS